MAGPRWVKLDVDYFRNPKAAAVGRAGRDLHLASICYAGAHLTDGHIPTSVLRIVLTDADVPRSTVGTLVDAGLWVPNGDGWTIHDYTAMQGTRAEVEARMADDRARKAAWREARRRERDAGRDT